MARKLQSASISFGLVSIPADLYTATSAESISFNQIHGPCGSRIKQQLFCPVCNRVVERSELVKGCEISKGQYVQLTEADLEQLEAAESQSIDIIQFLPLQAVDPIYFEKTYKGDRRKAIAAYETVVKLLPSFAEAHCNLGMLYEAEGRNAEAIQHYAAAKKLLKGKQPHRRLGLVRGSSPPHSSA